MSAVNPLDSNGAVECYWQLGADGGAGVPIASRLALLEHLMFEPLFDELRTKQQLGYSVGCSARCTLQVLGFVISVVSATASPADIEARIDAFVAGYLATLEAMSDAAWERNVEAAIANKLQDTHSIAEDAARAIGEIETRQYLFDRNELEASTMRSLTKGDFAKWTRRVLAGAETRRLTIRVHSQKGVQEGVQEATPFRGTLEETPLPVGARRIDGATQFKAKLQTRAPPARPRPPVDASGA